METFAIHEDFESYIKGYDTEAVIVRQRRRGF